MGKHDENFEMYYRIKGYEGTKEDIVEVFKKVYKNIHGSPPEDRSLRILREGMHIDEFAQQEVGGILYSVGIKEMRGDLWLYANGSFDVGPDYEDAHRRRR